MGSLEAEPLSEQSITQPRPLKPLLQDPERLLAAAITSSGLMFRISARVRTGVAGFLAIREPGFRPPGIFLPSAFSFSTQRRLPSAIAATTRALPSGVLALAPWDGCRKNGTDHFFYASSHKALADIEKRRMGRNGRFRG
jgi:hypothetical protein